MHAGGMRDALHHFALKRLMRTHAHREAGNCHAIRCRLVRYTEYSGSGVVDLSRHGESSGNVSFSDPEKWICRSFSATVERTRPLMMCRSTTRCALPTGIGRPVSTLSIPDLDENWKNRDSSGTRGETRLNSCVCDVHEGGYSTDTIAALRACSVVSVHRSRAA